MIMTKEQLEAFESLRPILSPIQREAVVLYGAALFRKGLYRGAVYGIVGAVIGGATAAVVHKVIKRKKTSKKENES